MPPKSRSAEFGFDPEELEQLQPSKEPRELDLAGVEQQIHVIQRRAELLRVATISLTLPEDWVRMGDFVYLQNKGCERISKAWGIEVDRVGPEDFTREDLPGSHVAWSVIVSGRCTRTGESKSEIGSRSTVSDFYRSRYEEAGPAEKTVLVYDCKKSALTNAHGRLTRALTGMSGIATAQLQKYGFDVAQIPSAEYTKGGKGGKLNADDASDKQIWKIAALACKDRRVEGLGEQDMDRTKAMLGRCRLTGGRQGSASRIIEWLGQQRQPVTMEAFLAEVGYQPAPAEGSAPGGAPAGAA